MPKRLTGSVEVEGRRLFSGTIDGWLYRILLGILHCETDTMLSSFLWFSPIPEKSIILFSEATI